MVAVDVEFDRDGFIVLFRSVDAGDTPTFAGIPWPELRGVRPEPEAPGDLLPLGEVPSAYLEEARRLAAEDPRHWLVAYYSEVTGGAELATVFESTLPAGMKWIGFDVGETVWTAFGGYSIIGCELHNEPLRARWWSRLNEYALFDDAQVVHEMLAHRQELLAAGQGLETHFYAGIRIYRVATLESAVPLGRPP